VLFGTEVKSATWIISLAPLLLGACAIASWNSDSRQDLVVGVKSFQEGDMATATLVLNHLLNHSRYDGLAIKEDQVTAHKYLAFIHCISDEVIQCRSEFRKALEIDPQFKLRPEEAGHPEWGPVFSEEKARFAK
jgi:Tfp pilus assembly protein PilF